MLLARNVMQEGADLEGGRRVEARGRFVEEENGWIGNKLKRLIAMKAGVSGQVDEARKSLW